MVKAAIVAFLVWVLGAARTTVRHKGLLLFLVAVFMLLTNLPIAVTMKYQAWVIQNYSRGYLTSYFVFIGVVILLAMVIDGIVGLAARRRSAWSRAAACLLAVTAFVVCYGTDFLNAHVSASQRQMYDRSRAVDAWIASPLFKDIPRDSVVFAPTLWDKYPSATHLFDDYWTRYALHYGFREQFDKPLARNRLNLIHVIDEETKPVVQSATAAGRLYYLKLVREPRSELTYVAFSRVPSIDPGHVFGSQEAWLLTHGRSDHLRVNGRVFGLSAECRARVLVNGTPSHGTFEGPFAVNVDHHWAAEPWLQTRLEAKGGLIDPETIAVSESAENVDNAVDVRYGEGFFPDEVAHRWAANEARLAILNRTDRSMLVDLRFDIRAPWAPAGSAHRVVVSAGSMKYEWPVDDTFRKHAVRVNVPAGTAVDVSFSTTAPRVDSAKDGRNLVLMFLPTFRAEEVGCESRDAG
jgi:hypothetical protein